MRMTDLLPENEAELAEALAGAASAGTPLEVTGGGTRAGLGRPVQAERTLRTGALRGLSLYEPGALTLVVRAGTPMAEIESALAGERQMLPFEPMDHRALLGTEGAPTIGGAVAVAASGPRRLQKGGCRDAMIGVRFVDGTGRVVNNGGRVMKNVTGVDLVKVMAGSHGTLGVLSEISFKLLPAPVSEVTLVRHGEDAETAVATMSAVLGSSDEVTAAAHGAPGVLGDDGMTLLRLEGLPGSVAYKSGRLGGDWERIEADESRALWRSVRDVTPFAGVPGAVWRVSVKPTDGPVLSAALRGAGLAHKALFDWGGGLVWLLVEGEAPDAGAALIREQVARLGGHATLLRAPQTVRAAVDVFQPENPVITRLSEGLRQKFDPSGILNPGRMRA